MDRVLIVGGNGFVGGRLYEYGKKSGYNMAIADIDDKCPISGYNYFQCNISEKAEVENVFLEFRPNLVINVAAIADIDFAEKNRDLAYRVNVTGAANCAAFTEKIGAAYIWFSSDAVFDGMADCYDETSVTCPVNYYGKTKQIGEERVAKENPNSIILRLSLVLGLPLEKGNSYVASLISNLKNGKEIYCPINEVRTPIDVYTLTEAVYELYKIEYSGLLHLGSVDSLNRYEISKYIAMQAGLDTELVKPLKDAVPGKAPRHKNGILSVNKAQSVLKKTKLLTSYETIKRSVTIGGE